MRILGVSGEIPCQQKRQAVLGIVATCQQLWKYLDTLTSRNMIILISSNANSRYCNVYHPCKAANELPLHTQGLSSSGMTMRQMREEKQEQDFCGEK